MKVKRVQRGDGDEGRREEGEEPSFYLLKGAALVVLFYEVGGVEICSTFPCVVAFRISLPLDEILEAF